MKKNFFFYAFAAICTVCLLASCEDDDSNNGGGSGGGDTVCYVLNSGNWGGNDACLQCYNIETGTASSPICDDDIFATQNNTLLGDLAQDALWVGGKLFVTVSGSQKLEILAPDGKRLREPYTYAQEGASPRMMATDGTNVYVTNYDGNVYVYDVASADFVKTIPVGARPEGISCCDGYLVVNNSGDLYAYNGTLSIIELATGGTTTVQMVNPYTQSVVCNGCVYIIDCGNYVDIPSNIYCVSPAEGTATSLGKSAALLAAHGNNLYYVNSVYNYDTWVFDYSPLYRLNVVSGDEQPLLSSDEMSNINSLSISPATGDIYVGRAEYGVLGTMSIYDNAGVPRGSFGVGYYTGGAYFEYR